MGTTGTAKKSGSLKVAEIVTKLYDMRDYMRRMHTEEEYLARVKEWAGHIQEQAKEAKQTETEVLIPLLRQYSYTPFSAWIQAAYVEMTEGVLCGWAFNAEGAKDALTEVLRDWEGIQRGGAEGAKNEEKTNRKVRAMGRKSSLTGMTVTISSRGRSVTMPADELGNVARRKAARDSVMTPGGCSAGLDGQQGNGRKGQKMSDEAKIVKVIGNVDAVNTPYGKEIVVKVAVANTLENRITLAMIERSAVTLTACQTEIPDGTSSGGPEGVEYQGDLFDGGNGDGDEE